MKKIYVVSLDDGIPLSDKLKDEIKVLAYLVYDEINGYECDDGSRILYRDGIIYNELLEKNINGVYVHRFEYNDIESGIYEPFMINDRSFAFTVNDGTINDDEINNIIYRVRLFSKITYKFNINSFAYEEDKKKNRLLAIKKIILDSQKKNEKKEDNVKVRVKSILPIIGLILR